MPLIDANVAVLLQGQALLERLPDSLYPQRIGPQFRHILDHYESLFRAFEHLEVDYEKRDRNPELELKRLSAIQAIEAVICRIQKLPDDSNDLPLRVRREEFGWSESSLSRELQFLLSHTVHHYAVVGLIAENLGVQPEPDFGVAPSTLRYRRATACAQ